MNTDFTANSLCLSTHIYTLESDNRGKGYGHLKIASSGNLAELLENDLVRMERKLGTISDFSRDYNL
jgi:hypothetical protein